MGEYKRKFGFYAAWNYELEIEDLNKMSADGWQLIKGGCFSSKFKKNTELQYRYQLDFHPRIEDKGRYIETFREQGWEYVNSTINGWHYFRKLYDVTKPEEEYEIFTDIRSIKEMNNRWVILGIVLALIWLCLFFRKLCSVIMYPNVLTLAQVVYMGGILAVFIRGIVVMKNAEKPKNARADRVLIILFLVWMVGGSFVESKISENRPMFNFSNISAEYGQIPELSGDLEEATKWLAFDVHYEDNYYMDIEVDNSYPLCISVVSETGKIIHTLTEKEYKEKNIRLHLEKGSYAIYFSDFPGGSIYVKASMR
ncbi:MAG: DUF2812 domain-containing protein [Lachnospiraceae bacterium]|nr:DUF2812 domain-containing protein [Lachnospiraceae bacterium]